MIQMVSNLSFILYANAMNPQVYIASSLTLLEDFYASDSKVIPCQYTKVIVMLNPV